MISIVMPVYNVKQYLSRAVDSVLCQSGDFELILVDDGSTDGSGDACDAYASADERVRVIHRENGGLSAARNTGIEAANGEWLFFPDSDDFIEPNTVAELVKTSEGNGSDLIVWGYYVDFERDGETYLSKTMECPNAEIYGDINPLTSVPSFLGYAWNKLYRRSIIIENNLRFSIGVSLVEDVLFNSDYIEKCSKITFINEKFNHYMQHGNSTLGTKFYDNAFELKIESVKAWKKITEQMHFEKSIADSFIESQSVGALMFYVRMTKRQTDISFVRKCVMVKKYFKRDDVKAYAVSCTASNLKNKLMLRCARLRLSVIPVLLLN